MTDEPLRINIEALVNALGLRVPNDDARGKLSTDLQDLVRSSRWLLNALGSITERPYTDDQLETLLIEIEVRYLDHATYHIQSLREVLTDVLATFPDDEG